METTLEELERLLTEDRLITEYDNEKFTWVGKEIKFDSKYFWRIKAYDKMTDQYYVIKRDDNDSLFVTSWIDAKRLRKCVIVDKTIRIIV